MENNLTISLSLSDEKISKIKEFYKEDIYPSKSEYISTLIKLKDVSITIYHSNKVVFQGKNAEYESKIWGEPNENIVWKYLNDQIGSDEVGTGDYFGPICVCASYVTNNDIEWLNQLGVNDSKTLTDEKIIKIAPELIKKIPYSQMSVDPIKYNSLIESGYNQGKIKAMLHNQVIHNLREKINKTVFTIIDQFVTESKYYEYIRFTKNIEKDITFETKAESKYPSVAVSSIIARYSFLVKMNALSKKIGETIPKGAGEHVDSFGKELVKKHGKDMLKEYAKTHFANTKKILGD